MKGVCPDCGFSGGLIAFVVDVEARKAIGAALKVMPDLEPLILRYMGMFRPGQRAMTMSRSVALLQDLSNAMSAGEIERGGRKWTVAASHWKTALEQMIESRDKIQLPLKSHGYLFEILRGLANSQEAQAEAAIEDQRKTGQHRRPPEKPEQSVQAPATKEIMRTEPVKASELVGGLMATLNGQ